MNQALMNGPWIVAQMMRIRALEEETKAVLAVGKEPNAALRARLARLNSQVALLDLALGD